MAPRLIWPARGGALLILLLAGWTAGSALRAHRAPGWPPRSNRIRVLTTIFPLYDFARQIGGSTVEVRNLLPPGVDPHEFALAPHDMDLVAGTDVIVANGVLDDFVMQALDRAGVTKRVVVCSEGLINGSDSDANSGISGDPHLWLDPVHAQRYVARIGDALAAAARGRAESEAIAKGIESRARALQTSLQELDDQYRNALAPLNSRAIIVFHAAFAHLARRYGLEIAAVWQKMPGREPAPRDVERILRIARERHVRVLFTEPQFSPRALQMIAADAGLTVATLDPLETSEDFDSSHYVEIMRTNLDVLTHSLSQ